MGRGNSLGRFTKWFAITIACALPMLIVMTLEAPSGDFAGLLLGVATWATGMTLFESFLAQRRSAGAVRALTIGFSAWALVQGAFALFVGREGAAPLITPYFVSALPGAFLLGALDRSGVQGGGEPLAFFVLTMSCGLLNFVAGLLFSGLVAGFSRPTRSPRPDTAPSPARRPPPLRE